MKDKEILFKRLESIGFMLIVVVLLSRAAFGPIWYAEIDSNTLPTISIQYHHSIFMDESDLETARIDYPTLYSGIYMYDDLRSSKLIQLENGKWMSWYFPIYPLFCIPLKLFFQLVRVSQERVFLVTNALLIIIAIHTVLYRLKISDNRRRVAAILLLFSPIVYYNNYINYEAFIFSLLTVSLVHYHNKELKRSAFVLSLAGMANSTVMAVGIVMVGEYLVGIWEKYRFRKNREQLKVFIKDTILYGICFIPSLIPFVVQYIYQGKGTFSESSTIDYWGARVLSYFFDPSLGFFSFAPIALLLFFALALLSVHNRKKHAIVWLLFLVGTVSAFSLMRHINCGMIYCARYLVWTYPIIPLYICCEGVDAINFSGVRKTACIVAAISSALLISLNHTRGNVFDYMDFNYVTKMVLDNVPQLYNPFSATFYSRTVHVDGAYWFTEPMCYLDSQTGEVRKIIFMANIKGKEATEKLVYGNESDLKKFRDKLRGTSDDGKLHYINIPRSDSMKLTLYPQSLSTEDAIWFCGVDRNADEYVHQGMSVNEGEFAWTDGKTMGLSFVLSDFSQEKKYMFSLDYCGTYGEQTVIVRAGETVVYEDTLVGEGTISFEIEPDKDGCVQLDFEFPGAVSPKKLGVSDDSRVLAMRLQKAAVKEKP